MTHGTVSLGKYWKLFPATLILFLPESFVCLCILFVLYLWEQNNPDPTGREIDHKHKEQF